MEKFRVGDIVLLPDTKYPDIIGVILQIDEDKCLVNFNSTQQLYFLIEELEFYLH